MRKALVGLITVGLLALAPAAYADSPNTTQTVNCTGGKIEFTGSPTLWPPNHKYRTYDIVATATIPADMVNLTSTVSSDEVIDGEELNGAGNTTDDVKPNPGMDSGTGSAEVVQQVRGERSGRGDGRTYTFKVMATFGMGALPCNATFTVTVPHDQRDHQGLAAKAKATATRTARRT